MRVLSSHQALRSAASSASGEVHAEELRRVVVIGNFDGVHLGHRQLFAQARRCATLTEVVALTFSPHPARVLAPQVAPPLICSETRRRERLCEAGVDILVEQPFDLGFAALSPREFVEEVLLASLRARFVVVGHDFTFGKGRAGNTETLRELLAPRGATAVIVPAFTVPDPRGGEPIVCSSTFVRRAVQAGHPERAALVLGRDPEVEGVVVAGAARGRQLGFPTANLQCDADLRPAVGIYAAWAEILEEIPAQRPTSSPRKNPGPAPGVSPGSAFTELVPRLIKERHPAAVSVGYNATFTAGGSALPPLSIEAHLIERGAPALPPFYGRTVRLHMRARLRDEERFSSIDELVAQIRRDIDATKSILDVAW
jgi:riboflavin kinase/FMN adenylyltransferase